MIRNRSIGGGEWTQKWTSDAWKSKEFCDLANSNRENYVKIESITHHSNQFNPIKGHSHSINSQNSFWNYDELCSKHCAYMRVCVCVSVRFVCLLASPSSLLVHSLVQNHIHHLPNQSAVANRQICLEFSWRYCGFFLWMMKISAIFEAVDRIDQILLIGANLIWCI